MFSTEDKTSPAQENLGKNDIYVQWYYLYVCIKNLNLGTVAQVQVF